MVDDPRDARLIGTVLDYALEISSADTLMVQGESFQEDFMERMAHAAETRGANVFVESVDIKAEKAMIERSDEAELEEEKERICDLVSECTARAFVYSHENPSYLDNVDPEKIELYQKLVKRPFLDIVVGDGKDHPGIKWNLFSYPSHADAIVSKQDYESFRNFVYSSIIDVDWSKVAEEMQLAKSAMDNVSDVHIWVPGLTDFHISLKGRGGQLCCGENNLPDGEFFYGPVEGSAEGYITFPHGTIYQGNYVEGVTLSFENGRVVKAQAKKGENFVIKTLSGEGADVPGELGVGCNTGITRPSYNILFDEKMGGTVHLAMGNSYKYPLNNGGGLNDSAVHWDMICDLRQTQGLPGGEIIVDGELIQRNGEWLL